MRLLILDEPTQGVDIGARIEVYRIINELTAMGIGVLLISSDYPELLAMSDRVAIVSAKRILEILPSSELSEYRLLEIASRANQLDEGQPLCAIAWSDLRVASDRARSSLLILVVRSGRPDNQPILGYPTT